MWSFVISETDYLSGELSWSEADGLEGTPSVVDFFQKYIENVYRPNEVIKVMNVFVTIQDCLKDGALLFHLVREVFPSAVHEGKQEPAYLSPTKRQLELFGDSFVQ